MADEGLLWKYLGLSGSNEPRLSFLDDCLFRITQLRALNDPFEVKPRILLDEYAEEDWVVAREEARQSGMFAGEAPDDEAVEGLFLAHFPSGRFDEKSFPGLYPARIPELREEPFISIAEFDEFQANKVRTTVESALNQSIGVFSLTEDAVNLLMWTHYGAQHRGIAVGFDRKHPFFSEVGDLRQVEYRPQRVAVSSNGGVIRIAGHILKEGKPPPIETLLRKHPDWAYEKEWRLLVPLVRANETRWPGSGEEPIHLLRFPETVVRAVILGARIADPQVDDIATRVRRDQRWKHLEIFRARLSEHEFALALTPVCRDKVSGVDRQG